MSDDPSDPLAELRERLRATHDAAERAAGRIPPGGWASPHDQDTTNVEEIEQLLSALRSLRELLPPDLQDQLRETIRQVLLLLRGILDLAVERLEPPTDRAAPVAERGAPPPTPLTGEDIPIL